MLTTDRNIDLKTIYEQDFNQWLEITANLLRQKSFNELDMENLIEEIEAMGKSQKRELESGIIILIMHLLKWKYQPQNKTRSWLNTINEQRLQLQLLLKYNPSLKSLTNLITSESYQKAVKIAVKETKLDLRNFPRDNPFTLEQIFDEDFFPESD
jgi:hypothetical protein